MGRWLSSGRSPLGRWLSSGWGPLGRWLSTRRGPLRRWLSSGWGPLGRWLPLWFLRSLISCRGWLGPWLLTLPSRWRLLLLVFIVSWSLLFTPLITLRIDNLLLRRWSSLLTSLSGWSSLVTSLWRWLTSLWRWSLLILLLPSILLLTLSRVLNALALSSLPLRTLLS